MIAWVTKLLKKYRELLLYGVVGVLTTVINMLAFWLLASTSMHYAVANVIAWALAVLFAFFANKIFVFENHGWSAPVVAHEAMTFFLSRAASLLVDEAGMWLMISVLHAGQMFSKLLVNIVVILINYVLGKFWVFGKKAPPVPEQNAAAEGNTTSGQGTAPEQSAADNPAE